MKLDKKYSLIKDHDKHYEIHDSSDNKRFLVSKRELHPATQLHILKHLPKYNEGGITRNSVFNDMPQTEAPPDVPRGTTNIADAGQSTALMDVNPETLSPNKPDLAPDALVQQSVAPQAARDIAQAQTPGVPPALTDPLGAMQKANDLGVKSANEEYQASAGKAQAEAKNQQEYAQQLKDIHNEQFMKSAETKDRLETLFNEANSGAIDPDRYWNNKSTGAKIGSILGIILGGLGQGLTGSNVNVAMKVINDGIDRDIDAQKANKSQKNNLYHMYLDKYKDDEEAYSRAKADLLTLAAAKTNMIAAQAGTPMAAAARDYMKAQLGTQAAQYGMQYAGASLGRKAVSEGIPVEAMSYLPEKQRESMVRLPNGFMADAGSSANAKEYNEQTAAYYPLIGDLKELKSLNSLGTLTDPAQRARASVLQNHVVTQLNDLAKSHRITEGDIGFQKGQLSDPNSIQNKLSTDWNAGTDQLMESLTRKYQEVGKQYVPALGNIETKKAQTRASIPTKAR